MFTKLGRIPILLMVFPAFLFPDIRNRDKPLKGEWDFRLEKVWQVEKAGEDVFGRPFTLTVAADETIYIFDAKNDLNYIFSKGGAFLKTFGRSGQGPGELTGQEKTHVIGDKLAIVDRRGIHYFSRDGEYLETSGQEKVRRPLQIIISKDEFIAFPMTGIGAPEGRGEMFYGRLDTGEERKISDFSMTQAGIGQSGENVVDIIVVGLSPMPVAGYHRGRVYWGVSHSYQIHISDLEGRKLGGFSIDRKTKKVSDSFKKKFFKGMSLPPEMVDLIAKSFSNKLTYFHQIEVHDGIVYVFVPDLDLDQGTARIAQIDIFSSEGRYLYRARLDFGKNLTHLFSPLSNLAFKNGHLYAVCVREDDTVVLAKFKANLPVE
ncbi:MAG: 6-bladed beta-propeller [Candidatus Aminicenantales bacterium]